MLTISDQTSEHRDDWATALTPVQPCAETAHGMNRLYCGDNLRVLRDEIGSESVDLVYLDPPFNSNQNFNVLFAERDGRKAAAQQRVFEDSWEWNQASSATYQETIGAGGRIADVMRAFHAFLGPSNMLAYLSMMAPRLAELHRVLKPTGSLYLHCDQTASHYLKLLLDGVFGPTNFRNDITWKRKAGRGETQNAAVRFGVTSDVILFYAKSADAVFHRQYRPNNAAYIQSKFTHVDENGRRYRLDNLTSPSPRPNLTYEYKGYRPPEKGWAVCRERMEEMEREGRVYFPHDKTKRLQRKRFLDELPGETVDSLWDDIPPINSQAQERLGYPTQKPEALLERIISASSEPGDVVLDPFCGCGTAVAVAQELRRHWIGIDITHLAIGVIRGRLHNDHPDAQYEVRWVPTTTDEASELAREDPFQFQCWILGELGINPLQQKRGADRGVDGRLFFFDGPDIGKPQQIIFSVKGGALTPAFVRDLGGVVKRERAQIGVLVTMEKPTKEMIREAAAADPYRSHDDSLYPGLQILTVAEILSGKQPQRPEGRTVSLPSPKMAKAVIDQQQQRLRFG